MEQKLCKSIILIVANQPVKCVILFLDFRHSCFYLNYVKKYTHTLNNVAFFQTRQLFFHVLQVRIILF